MITNALRATGYVFALPFREGKRAIRINIQLWTHTFWDVWEPLPFDIKLTWIAFVVQTIGILTLIELFFFKK